MPEANKSVSQEKMTEYEKQRMKRIQENKERMKALGLHNLAASTSSFMASVPISNSNKKSKKKLKKDKEDDDEDYKPKDDEFSSSSDSGKAVDDDDDDYYHDKPKLKKSTPSKKASKLSGNSGFVVDDDDALMKAIALSLQDSPGFLDVASKTPPQLSDAKASSVENTERKQIVHMNDSGKRKRKNLFSSRVQMTEDELILHFFQFDEMGKGGINLRDLRRLAASHDFTWKDEEMDHMIRFFDSDLDGKISLEDFTKIVERCNMRQGSENAEQAS